MVPLGDQRAELIGTGWDGGRLRTWSRDGATALAVSLAFDRPADAGEACEGIPDWYATVAGASATDEPGTYLAAAGDL